MVFCMFLGKIVLKCVHFVGHPFNSVRDECGRGSMDRTKRPRIKRWFPQCLVTVCDDVISGALMLLFTSYLCPSSFLAETETSEENLVAQQEVLPQENPSSWT